MLLAASFLFAPPAIIAGEPGAKKPTVITIGKDTAFAKDLVVEAGQKLVVKPGVTLRFAEGAGIVARGVIEARGTKDKPIVFTAKDPGKGWGNVSLLGKGADGSVLEHCRFSLGRGRKVAFDRKLKFVKFAAGGEKDMYVITCGGALFIYGTSKANVRHCRFTRNIAYWGAAVSCWGGGNPTISGCYFGSNGDRFTEDAGAIHCVLKSNPLIRGNYFEKNTAKYGGALHCLHGSAPAISGNYISGNKARGNSSAISCFNRASPAIAGNFISGNTVQRDKGVAIETVSHSKPTIKGNYIRGNINGKEKEANLHANDSFGGKPDESTCEEQEPAKKEDVLRALKKAGVLDLAPPTGKDASSRASDA